MPILKNLAIVAVLIFAFSAPGQAGVQRDDEMSGYTLRQFGKFEKNWHLVTVRFRKDTGELRFTYANPLAWKTLKQNKTDYPDGAIFAKIGRMTQGDPDFPSSAVPSGAVRIQFMVRNLAKHAATDGWGYALFDARGKIFADRPEAQPSACAACHRIVRDRGEVFSQIMGELAHPTDRPASWISQIRFEDRQLGSLPPRLREALPSSTKTVRSITGELTRHLFGGTLDEMQPTLTEESIRSDKPAVLVSEDGSSFSAVFREDRPEGCPNPSAKPMKGLHTVPSENVKLYETHFCHRKSN